MSAPALFKMENDIQNLKDNVNDLKRTVLWTGNRNTGTISITNLSNYKRIGIYYHNNDGRLLYTEAIYSSGSVILLYSFNVLDSNNNLAFLKFSSITMNSNNLTLNQGYEFNIVSKISSNNNVHSIDEVVGFNQI